MKGRYKDVVQDVKTLYGVTVKTCWIADVKEQNGVPTRPVWNRQGGQRKNPCPASMTPIIEASARKFKLI